ncbi:MAG: four helix bundle protein [Bacteroidia bacterium]
MEKSKTYDLENRLVDFAASIVLFTNTINKSYAGVHLSNQITRSGTSPALNYGEAQAAESRKDFIHKMNICLKELRETKICLQIIAKTHLSNNNDFLDKNTKEASELIAIFTKSISTAKKKQTPNLPIIILSLFGI